MERLGLYGFEYEREFGPFADNGSDVDLRMVGGNDAVTERETETESFFAVAHLVLHLVELVEYLGDFFFGNADAGIRYGESYTIRLLSQEQGNRTAFMGELVRVGQKIEQYLLHAVDIDVDRRFHSVGLGGEFEFDRFLLGNDFHAGFHFFDEVGNEDFAHVERHLSLLDLGETEHVVDKVDKPERTVVGSLDDFANGSGQFSEIAFESHGQIPLDGGHGSAEFVGNERDEVVFQAVELNEFFFDALERIDFAEVGNDSDGSSARNRSTGKKDRNELSSLGFQDSFILGGVAMLAEFVILLDGPRAFFVPKNIGFFSDDFFERISEKLAEFRIGVYRPFVFVTHPYAFLHGVENALKTVYPDFFESGTGIESVSIGVCHWD